VAGGSKNTKYIPVAHQGNFGELAIRSNHFQTFAVFTFGLNQPPICSGNILKIRGFEIRREK
jgi:hypothetical protein